MKQGRPAARALRAGTLFLPTVAVSPALHTRPLHATGLSLVLLASIAILTPSCAVSRPCESGPLIIVGGGGTPTSVIETAVACAGGTRARVAVLPQASRRGDAGHSSATMFTDAGAAAADVLELSAESLEGDQRKLERATLIWFPGGSQNRLMERLREAGLVEVIRRRHREGTAVGGTSAGAAVMSPLMITGAAALKSIERDATVLGEGLGLLPGSIVDQHFHRRQRFNRLLSATISNPDHIGIGIDERTAILVRHGNLFVLGESSVLIIEAGPAESAKSTSDDTTILSARGLRLHLLAPGMSYTLPSGPAHDSR